MSEDMSLDDLVSYSILTDYASEDDVREVFVKCSAVQKPLACSDYRGRRYA